MTSIVRKVYQRVNLINLAIVLAVSSLASFGSALLAQTANATSVEEVVYTSLPSVTPDTNYASLGYQATSTSEFGDYVHLAGTNRALNTITVTMSDWAKFSDYSSNPTYSGNNSSWSLPATVNVYSNHLGASGSPDTLLATKTQTVSIPWRPESDSACGSTSNGNGWKVDGTCYNFSGIASNITFDLSSQNVVLPDDVIVGVAYNTQTHGYAPTGVAGPYNSLNVAIPENQTVSVGSDDSTDSTFWNTSHAGFYTDGGAAGVGIFRQDTNWTPNGTVAFEITATAIDTSSTTFVNDPKYVRVNNSGDLAAQIVTPDTTTGVHFFVDGNTATPISGSNVGGAGATTSWWRLYTPLAAGSHTISAQIEISGHWYDVADTGIVYSIDLPWAEYVIPHAGQFFRPNDKVVRIKADDEFNQFNYMKTTINGVTHTINRTDCSDQGSYVLCDVQNLGLPEGPYTATTTTYTMANNRVDNLVSPTFTIDSTAPSLTNFQVTSPSSVYGSSITVSANATDSNGIDNVTFYVTAPRVGDGVCDGNGTHLVSALGTLTSGSTYSATLDTSGLDGDYCLNAIAGDVAANHSTISKIKVLIDTTAPLTPTLSSPYDGVIMNGTSVTQSWTDASSDVDHYIYESYNNATATSLRWHEEFSTTSKTATNVTNTTYWWRVKAVDHAGNISPWSDLWKITIDNDAPTGLENLSPLNGAYVTTAGQTSIDWTDANDSSVPISYYYQSSLSSATNLDGSFVSPAYTSGALSSSEIPTPGTPEGIYYWHVRAVDAAGNSTAWTSSWKITVDNTAPVVTVTAPTAGDYGFINTVNINANIDDAVSYAIYVNGIDVYDGTGAFTPYPLSVTDGTYNIYVEATDAAGNVGTSATTTITVDDTAPVLTVVGYTGTSLTPAITGTTDSNTDMVTVDGDAAIVNSDGTWTYTLPTQTVGTHTITVISTDSFGNATTETATVTITEVPATETTPATTTTTVTPNGTTTTNTGDQGVLGAATVNDNNTSDTTGDSAVEGASDNKTATVDTNTTDGVTNFFGLAWYWWLLILAGIIALIWGIVAALRRRSEEA